MFLRITILCALALTGMAAASFVAPVEKNPPFRRDRLPLNSDLMISLSRDLSTLAQGMPLDKPEHRRSAAQALALALALDPANQGARDIVAALADGRELQRPDSTRFDVAKKRIWKSYEWLSLPQAGSDGNTLASLLGDPAHALDADRDTSSDGGANASAWSGWVAPLVAFNKKEEPSVPDPLDGIETEKPDPTPREKPTADGVIALEMAQIETVLHTYEEPISKWRQALAPLKMEASKNAPEREEGSESLPDGKGNEDFEITIPSSSSERFRIERAIIGPIGKALSSRLPEKGQIKILPGSNGRYSYGRNHTRLSGPAFILANAAITGVEPQGVVLAELDQEGKLVVPKYFWQMLLTITGVEGKRIILPKGSEQHLVNLLTLDNPSFFLKNEVFIASSNEEYIALCAKEGTPERKAISERFKEITDKANGQPLGPYLTNRFVRERLAEIVAAAPYHMSAKLLLLQGSPVRPRYLSKEILAAEVWSAIDPLNAEIESGLDSEESTQLDEIYETLRKRMEDLERYTDLRSQDVLNSGKELLPKMRSYMRNLRGRGELWERYDEISAARKELIKANSEVREALSKISGDPLPEDLKKSGRSSRRDR